MKTFNAAFQEYFELNRKSWLLKTQDNKLSIYKNHIEKNIGSLYLNRIKPSHILLIIRKLESENKTKTTRTVLQVIRKTFNYAIACEYCEINPAISLSDALKPHVEAHRPFVSENGMARLFNEVSKNGKLSKQGKIAFLLIAYTAVRSNEATKAKWSEFNFSSSKWEIPASRMKMKNTHIVPLSYQIREILIKWREECPSDIYVFPSISKHNQPINGWMLSRALVNAGYQNKQTIHGFRHRFSTSAYESNHWRDDAIEVALAHRIGGVKGVYNKAKYLDERQKLMQWYANKIEKWSESLLASI